MAFYNFVHSFLFSTYNFKSSSERDRIIAFFSNFDEFICEEAMWQISESIKPRGKRTTTKWTLIFIYFLLSRISIPKIFHQCRMKACYYFLLTFYRFCFKTESYFHFYFVIRYNPLFGCIKSKRIRVKSVEQELTRGFRRGIPTLRENSCLTDHSWVHFRKTLWSWFFK